MTDHHVLNGDQGQEEHEADDVVSANDELAECLNHPSRGGRALTAVQQNAAAAGEIERQAQEGQQKSKLGKTENCTGRKICTAESSTSTEMVMLMVSSKSRMKLGKRHQHDEHQAHGERGDNPVRAVCLD